MDGGRSANFAGFWRCILQVLPNAEALTHTLWPRRCRASICRQYGNDTLLFNGSNAGEKIDLSANGPRLRLTRDYASIVMDINGVGNVTVNEAGSVGATTFNNLTGTGVKNVTLNQAGFDGRPDASLDAVIVLRTAANDAVTLAPVAGGVKKKRTGQRPVRFFPCWCPRRGTRSIRVVRRP
jgi:hypothetical protein